jgi:hypothetical protein
VRKKRVPSRKKLLLITGSVAIVSLVAACVVLVGLPKAPRVKKQTEGESPPTVSVPSRDTIEELMAVGEEASQAAGGEELTVPSGAGETISKSEVERLITTAPAEALEGIYRTEVERFIERLREDNLSTLEIRSRGEWLTMCLADETASRAFEDWLFKRARDNPDDVQFLLTAMATLGHIAPDVLHRMVDRAISENNWLVAGSALSRLKKPGYSPEWIAAVAEKALASDDRTAQYYAVTLADPAVLPREVCERLIRPILLEGHDNSEVETAALFRALTYDLADQEEVLEILEQKLLSDNHPAQRYGAYGALYRAARLGLLSGEQGEATRTAMMKREALSIALSLDYTAMALRDPDRVVRLAATVHYLECERYIETARRSLAAMP